MRRHRRRRCCAAALRRQHCGFGSHCQLCSQDTHWLHFSVFVDALHNHEAVTTPSPLPGQAALRGESGCSSRKALPGPRSSAPGRRRSVAIIAVGQGCEDMLTRHVQLWFSYLVCLFLHVAVFWFFEVGRRAAAAPGLLRLGSAIEGHVWESYQDTRRNLIFQ